LTLSELGDVVCQVGHGEIWVSLKPESLWVDLLRNSQSPIVGLSILATKSWQQSICETYELGVEAGILLCADLGEQIGVESELAIVWEDNVGLEIP
jgi:hypothetical protein